METKWTPGPWSVGYNAYQVIADNGNMNVCDIRGWGYLTGKGSLGLSDDKAKEIQEANAHLIASAPLLYEVCAAIERLEVLFILPDEIPEEHRDEAKVMYDLYQDAMKALKKARGEVQE